jgi:hypothetical protein
MTVKKYYPTISCGNAEMEEDDHCGQWVSCDDYEALEAECGELKSKLAEIEKQEPVAFHNGEYFFESGRKYYSLHVDRRLQDLPKGNLYAKPIANNSEPAFEITDECGRPMTYWGGKVTPNKAEVPDWENEAKRAFWTGLEIGAIFGSTPILPRWNEYIAKRKGELSIPNFPLPPLKGDDK